MMTYKQTLDWLFIQLPMYQIQGASAYRKDLDNTILLASYLNNPERKIKTIHVAGTNGKGSTSSMIASVLQEAGYKVGLYTSPHLKDFRERIKINGEEISEIFVVDFIEKHKGFFEKNNLSFFEMTVGLAFDYFVKEQIDIAVIETGMGGRLDSTNIITPLVSVITNIGLDHMQFLGNSIPEIAGEKAGIIKTNVPVVIGEYTSETKSVFLKKATNCHTDIYFASDLIQNPYPSDLSGHYQVQNVKTVMQTIAILQLQKDFIISDENIKSGLMNVIINTGLQGRWQQLQANPKVICDAAHNSHGLKRVLDQIENESFDTLHFVLGFVNDKDLNEILPLFPKKARYYFSKPNIPRGLDANILQEKAKTFGLMGNVYSSISIAYREALKNASKQDFVYIGGSTFVVAEIL